MDILIYESKNFTVEAVAKPHVSREEGGHVKIKPKRYYENRRDLPIDEANEVMILSMLVGEAMKIAMNKRWIPVLRINYHDMGNWAYKKDEKPYFHIHVYGRAENAKIQVRPESLQLPDRKTGFYDTFQALNDEDIMSIQQEIQVLLSTTYEACPNLSSTSSPSHRQG